jgi:hypothetical protein
MPRDAKTFVRHTSIRDIVLAPILSLADPLLFRIVQREKTKRHFCTSFNNDVLLKAIRFRENPMAFYDLAHKADLNNFQFIESNRSNRLRDLECETWYYRPSFFYPEANIDMNSREKAKTNDIRLFRKHNSRNGTCLILLNAWGVKSTPTDQYLAEQLATRFDVATVLSTLPFHRNRTPANYESGELALNGDAAACLSSFKQAVEIFCVIGDFPK